MLGIIVIARPPLTSFAIELTVGAVLIVGGAAQIVEAFWRDTWQRVMLDVLGGILASANGGAPLAFPKGGALTLTMIVAAYFVAEEGIKIVRSLQL